MRFKMLINLFSSRFLWGLLLWSASLGLLLLHPANGVVWASSTPVIRTPTPNGLGTPTAQGFATNIVLDFRQSDQFFEFLGGGTRIDGVGMLSEGDELHIEGNGNGYAPVQRVALFYSSLGTGTLEFTVYDGATSIAAFSVNVVNCSNCTNIVFNLPNVALDNMEIETHTSALFTLKTITLTVLTGSIPTSTVAFADGCPILTDEQIDALDPDYARSCSRCFATPTPVRDSAIPTRSFSTLTPDGTSTGSFGIPVIVSGTPQTATPMGLPGGGVLPTETPSATPGGAVCNTTEGIDLLNDWEAVPFGFGFGTTGSFFGTYFQGEYAAGAEGRLLRIERFWDGSEITAVSALIDENCTTTTTSGHTLLGLYLDDFEYGVVFSNICPATQTNLWVEIPVDHELGVNQIDLTTSTFGNTEAYIRIKAVKICGDLDVIPTQTPIPSPTPLAWVNPPASEVPANCELVEFRNTTPLVEVPEFITVTGYECYVVVPEIVINIPGQADDWELEGQQICVTWFAWPIIEFMGIPIPVELVIGMSILGWFVRRLLMF